MLFITIIFTFIFCEPLLLTSLWMKRDFVKIINVNPVQSWSYLFYKNFLETVFSINLPENFP